MSEANASSTADFVALARAIYSSLPEARLFRDHLAVQLLEPGLRSQLQSLQSMGADSARELLLGLGSSLIVLCRARYTEEALATGVAEGIIQYVILGAGLDSFAYRAGDFPVGLRVFELDLPATQALKRERLEAAGLEAVYPLEYVSVDFATQGTGDALRDSSFDPGYLRENPRVEAMWRPFLEYTADRGEPVINGYAPEDLQLLAESTGWHVSNITDALQYTARSLEGPGDVSWPTSDSLLVTLEKP